MKIIRLKKLPTPGYGCNEASFIKKGVNFEVEFTFEENGDLKVGKIIFSNIVAFKYANESHAENTSREAYDSIAEIVDSEWLGKLKLVVPDGNRWPFERRHFLIFLKNVGYFEIIASDFTEKY